MRVWGWEMQTWVFGQGLMLCLYKGSEPPALVGVRVVTRCQQSPPVPSPWSPEDGMPCEPCLGDTGTFAACSSRTPAELDFPFCHSSKRLWWQEGKRKAEKRLPPEQPRAARSCRARLIPLPGARHIIQPRVGPVCPLASLALSLLPTWNIKMLNRMPEFPVSCGFYPRQAGERSLSPRHLDHGCFSVTFYQPRAPAAANPAFSRGFYEQRVFYGGDTAMLGWILPGQVKNGVFEGMSCHSRVQRAPSQPLR